MLLVTVHDPRRKRPEPFPFGLHRPPRALESLAFGPELASRITPSIFERGRLGSLAPPADERAETGGQAGQQQGERDDLVVEQCGPHQSDQDHDPRAGYENDGREGVERGGAAAAGHGEQA